jgi:hypothetical protein
MEDKTLLVQGVSGALAGLLILGSILPELVSNFKEPTRARNQSPKRAALQAAGNTLVCVNALATDNHTLSVVAGAAVFCLLLQFYQIRRARRGSG